MRHLTSRTALVATGLSLLAGTGATAAPLEVVGQPLPEGTGFQPAVTSLASGLQHLDYLMLIIISAITLFVVLLLAVVILRFNRRANPEPKKFTHNTPLEIAWTLIPIVILVFIGSFSVPQLRAQQTIPAGDVHIKVTGNQWFWSYEYTDEGISFDSFMLAKDQLEANGYAPEQYLLATDTAVVVPVGKVVVVEVTAADVIHSWKVPAFGVMQDGIPGRLAHLWFTAEKEGVYFGQCSELCGKDHSYMPITVKVVSQEAYAKWVEGAKQGNLQLAAN